MCGPNIACKLTGALHFYLLCLATPSSDLRLENSFLGNMTGLGKEVKDINIKEF